MPALASVFFRATTSLAVTVVLMAQVPRPMLQEKAEELTNKLRRIHLSQDEPQALIDYEGLFALAELLDRDSRPGTSAKAAECLVWCLGLVPGQPASARAYVKLAGMYRQGRGVPKDETFATELEAELMRQIDAGRPWGHAPAEGRLVADLLESGRIYPKDLLAAAAWRFHDNDRERGMKLCRSVFESEPGRRREVIMALLEAKEFEEARSYLRDLRPLKIVSTLDVAFLMSRAGLEAEALRLLTEASEAGDSAASRNLAGAYRDGKGFGIKAKDGIAYLHHLKLAADRSDQDACLQLGQAYWLGEWTTADPKQAVAWFQKAGTYGSTYLAEAQFLGRGLERNLVAARALFEQLYQEGWRPDVGCRPISERLRQIHEEGMGTPKDPVLVVRFTSEQWGGEALPIDIESLLTESAPESSWIELGATLKAHGRFGAAAKVFQKAIAMGSRQAEAELGDLHLHDRRERDDFRDEFNPDKELGKRLVRSALSHGIRNLSQPLGWSHKDLDYVVSLDPDIPGTDQDADPDPSLDSTLKAKKFATGDGVSVDSVRALYYELCALRDAPGC